MAEHPLDARIALWHPGEDELGRGESRVEQESDKRHEPVVRHCFHTDGARRVNVQHGTEPVGLPVQRLESFVGEGNAVHVAEEHRAREMQLCHRAP